MVEDEREEGELDDDMDISIPQIQTNFLSLLTTQPSQPSWYADLRILISFQDSTSLLPYLAGINDNF